MYSENSSDILERMLSGVPNDLNKSEGSFVYDSLSPISDELAQSKIQLDEVLNRVFAISSAENGYSDELELRCAEFGIYRKDGTKASGKVTFSGSDNTIIPKDTLVQTEGGLRYKTVHQVTIIDGQATADIVSVDIGNEFNLPSRIITEMPIQITGITDVINENPIIGGTEKESDYDLLNRLLLKVRTPATSGNIGHYKLWATEVNGVGDAVVIPTWEGAGTVKVIVLDSNKHTPSQSIIEKVTENIEINRPVGAVVTVEGATEIPINISATLQLATGSTLEEVKAQIQNGVKAYLETLAFKDPLVRYTRIANVLLDIPPIIDYSNLLVNGGTSNIEINQGSVAILGNVVVTSAT